MRLVWWARLKICWFLSRILNVCGQVLSTVKYLLFQRIFIRSKKIKAISFEFFLGELKIFYISLKLHLFHKLINQDLPRPSHPVNFSNLFHLLSKILSQKSQHPLNCPLPFLNCQSFSQLPSFRKHSTQFRDFPASLDQVISPLCCRFPSLEFCVTR